MLESIARGVVRRNLFFYEVDLSRTITQQIPVSFIKNYSQVKVVSPYSFCYIISRS